MSARSWPFAALALTGALAIFVVFAAMPWMAQTCTETNIDAGKPLLAGAGGCIEFWFNRYQTLLGVLAAVGAAWVTWRGAMKQVGRADAQIGLLRQQLAIDHAEMLSEKVSYVAALYDAMSRIHVFEQSIIGSLEDMEEEAARIADLASKSDLNYKHVYDNEFKEIHITFTRRLDVFDRNVTKMVGLLDEIKLPKAIHDMALSFVLSAEHVQRQFRAIAPTVSPDLARADQDDQAIAAVFRDIAGCAACRPPVTVFGNLPAYDAIAAQRDKLIRDRDRATLVAEVSV